MSTRWATVLLVTLSLQLSIFVGTSSSQWSVYDGVADMNAKLAQAQFLLQSGYQAQNLLTMNALVLDQGYMQDLSQLQLIIQDTDGLVTDMTSLQRQLQQLFHLDTAPSTTSALAQRMQEIRALRWKARSYQLRLQLLTRTAIRIIQRLSRLSAAIGGLGGNLQAQQTLIQIQGNMTHAVTKMQVQASAAHEAEAYDKLEQQVLHKSMENITREAARDYPRVLP